MQKKLILAGIALLSIFALGACGGENEASNNSSQESGSGSHDTHTYVEHEAVSATCDAAGNEKYYTCEDCERIFDAEKNEISSIPTIEASHTYTLVTEKAGTCSTKGEIAHYTCDACDKLFDLTKAEITAIEGDYDSSNHSSETLIAVQTQPTKLTYKAGETFDPTGMVVAYKCADCEGEILDNQFLTYVYQTEGATAFVNGDTKLTVNFNGLSFDLDITAGKEQTQILGVQEEYTTSCGVAPVIEATSNLPESVIVIKYYDEEQEISATDMLAGNTYTAKVFIEETEFALGAEVTTTVKVEHIYSWAADAEDGNKLVYQCGCGNAKGYYVMNNQEVYVDDADMSIDLSKFVVGAENYSVKSIQQIQLLSDNAKVDIEGSNEGMVYTFAQEKYERLTEEWTPYYLALSVVYTIDGVDCEVTVTAKYVEKVIRNAEDLLALAYNGTPSAEAGGTAIMGQYVLVNDIDASGLSFGTSNPAWQAGIGFQGVFEGNGYTISNLAIGSHGLFGAIGYNGKIQNVNFKNVNVAKDCYLLAFAIRNAYMTNVNVEFALNTSSYRFANEANDCTFENVTITTCKGELPFNTTSNTEMGAVSYNYFSEYTVTFDTDGGNEIESVAVTAGRTVAKPATPTKTSEEYDYVFLGWYVGDTEWDFNTPIMEEITLVAKWEQKEKLNETQLIENAINAISALPESVTMPMDIHFISAILEAQAAYNALSDEGKAQVTNAAKLQNLAARIKGYETIYVPTNDGGVSAIPGTAPCKVTSDVAASGAFSKDATYGNIFTATSGAGGAVSIQFNNFPNVSKYSTIYFYVRSNIEGYLYIAEDTGNGGYGINWVNNYKDIEANYGQNNVIKDAWSLIAFDTSKGYFTSNWFISVWSGATDFNLEIGAIVGYDGSAVGENKREVTLDWGVKTATGETNEYGAIYNLSREQYYIDNNNTGTMGTLQPSKLANALPEGYEYFVFWIYNPTATDQTFHLAGDVSGAWTDSTDFTTLKAGAWTMVTISNTDIQLNKQGQWYVYIGNSDAAGWQISSIYAAKA